MKTNHDISTARLRVLAALALVLAGALADAVHAPGQESSRQGAGTISGLIVDAGSSLPLVDATVVLETRGPGAFPARTRGSSAFLQGTRTTRTDSAGRYRFAEVSPGEYRLHVQRLGYRSATVEVDLRGITGSTVSVGLEVEPVALQPVEVSAPGMGPGETYGRRELGRARGNEEGERRVAVERLRQEFHLASDVRAVTHADVAEGITLGETDLFRALQRLPGVSAGDEYSAELWTRGAPWDQTRVYFDGLPLFHPVHALGGFSGVNPDAIGAVFLHPGVQPVALGGGAAGVLDLRSRRGRGSGKLRGTGELSLVSARGALDRASEDGRHAWMAAGRRTYLDLATGLAEWILTRDQTYRLPYSFRDLAARYDHQVGDDTHLEVSGLLQWDAINSTNSNLLNRISSDWGGGAARTTLHTAWGGVQTRHTLGFSGFGSVVRPQNEDLQLAPGNFNSEPPVEPSSNRILYFTFRGEIDPRGASGAPAAWSAGYELVNQEIRFAGPRPLALALLDPHPVLLRRDDRLHYVGLWGERRWNPAEALTVTTGLRLEAGPAVRNGGSLRLAPRAAGRYQLTPELSLSAAAGRTYQYAQAVGPSGAPADQGLQSDYLWVLAGDSVPAARADVATLGMERWLGAGWLGGVTAYLRRTTGVAAPDPTPGLLREKPLFVSGANTARGVELSARRLAGRWTASAAYTLGASTMEAGGLRFPASSEQRHALDLTTLLRVGPYWQIGAAYTAASGTPYTRTLQGKVVCELGGTNCRWQEEPRQEDPSGERHRAYQSLDLLTEWTRASRGWNLGVFLQLHNVLNHRNPGRYLGSEGAYCTRECWGYERDEFLPGLPMVPVLGARVTF
jgi:hypothetical protein